MKKAIKQKLMNMVNINHYDAIIQSNIGSKNIDLASNIPIEDLTMFINGEIASIDFSISGQQKIIEEELQKTKSASQFMEVVQKYNCMLTDYRQELLNNNFNDQKGKIIKVVLDQVSSWCKKILSIYKLAKSHQEDTCVFPLYIATNFISGRTPSYNYFKSPLTLIKVQASIEGSRLYIEKVQDEPVVNEKFLAYLMKEFNYSKRTLTEILEQSNTFENTIQIIEEITEKQVDLSKYGTIQTFEKIDWNTPDISENLEVVSNVILGIYEPDGGLLKENLKWMIDNNVDPFDVEVNKDKPVDYYQEKVIREQHIVEIGNPLNVYQKYAIASGLEQNTLIYGPPGTGKSEVIANLIFNILLLGKSSILVSEKRAALDVLTERIKTISKFSLPIHDLKDKESFYARINELNNLLGQQWYREKTKGSKNVKIESIKFSKQESLFLSNIHDWYLELLTVLKKHWIVEDFQDGIYKYDYQYYDVVKKELGQQLITEWLHTYNDNKMNLLDQVANLMIEGNFTKIEDLFYCYERFIKFIKKYKLLEQWDSKDIKTNLAKIIKKVVSNSNLIESYLTNKKAVDTVYIAFNEFKDKYEDDPKFAKLFFELPIKEQRALIENASQFINFKKQVILSDYVLSNKSHEELIDLANKFKVYFEKYQKYLEKDGILDFLIEHKDKVLPFLSMYEGLDPEHKKVLLAEFFINGELLSSTNIDECSLSLREITQINKDAVDLIAIVKEFAQHIESFGKQGFDSIIKYIDVLNMPYEFVEDLSKMGYAYSQEFKDIYTEWDWLSLPFLKDIYLEHLVLFDLDKVDPIMKSISNNITSEQFKKLKIVLFWEKIIKNNSLFHETKGRCLQDIVFQLQRETIRSASMVEEIVFKKYIQNLRTFLSKLPQEEKDTIATIFKLASSNNSLPAPAKFIQHYYSSLKKIFPIWVARPDNVATLIPMNQNEFDYGIFDEASQMTIERGYPVIYRSKIRIVAGDDKQLKPTSFFQTKVVNQEFDIDDLDSVDSLLDRVKTAWWNEFHLKNHYRSWSKDLIQFSNKFIYNNNLEVASKNDYLINALEVYNVNGTWDTVNEQEADAVIELIIENHDKFNSILVVTFNAKQSMLLENKLMDMAGSLPSTLNDKIEQGLLKISNLENVQGNEGDLVILSVAYGRNPEGILRCNFGPLIAHGGLNRLNVAITRAKQKMIVVKSLYAHEIKLSNLNNENAVVFKKFIEYVDSISNEKSINELVADSENAIPADFDDSIIKEIYAELVGALSNKYSFLVNVNIGSKPIDIAIIDKEQKKIVKAIIVEKWKENRNFKYMIENIDRQYFLESRGYSTFRVKAYEWYIEKDRIISKIKDSLSSKPSDNKIDYVLWNYKNS